MGRIGGTDSDQLFSFQSLYEIELDFSAQDAMGKGSGRAIVP
jgi:hypothetical protein